MTKVRFFVHGDDIVAVTSEGHTGYAESGEDIVCAALSSMMQTAVLGLMKVAKVNVGYHVDEKDGILEVRLPNDLSKERNHDAQVILNTLMLGVSDMYEGFSDFIDMEVIK